MFGAIMVEVEPEGGGTRDKAAGAASRTGDCFAHWVSVCIVILTVQIGKMIADRCVCVCDQHFGTVLLL